MTFPEWRRLNRPSLRREAPVGITLSTGVRRIYTCLCGSWESCSNEWPVTVRVRDFVAEHNKACWPDGVDPVEPRP